LGILKQDIDHSIEEDRFLLIDFVRAENHCCSTC
jgi:hypothetical protein